MRCYWLLVALLGIFIAWMVYEPEIYEQEYFHYDENTTISLGAHTFMDSRTRMVFPDDQLIKRLDVPFTPEGGVTTMVSSCGYPCPTNYRKCPDSLSVDMEYPQVIPNATLDSFILEMGVVYAMRSRATHGEIRVRAGVTWDTSSQIWQAFVSRKFKGETILLTKPINKETNVTKLFITRIQDMELQNNTVRVSSGELSLEVNDIRVDEPFFAPELEKILMSPNFTTCNDWPRNAPAIFFNLQPGQWDSGSCGFNGNGPVFPRRTLEQAYCWKDSMRCSTKGDYCYAF